jgi:hypothetical protein
MSLIEQGKLKAIRIGDAVRIPETELEKLLDTCAVVSSAAVDVADLPATEALPSGIRWCATRTGRAKFRARGTIAEGVDIWPGKMQSPIRFPKTVVSDMLETFAGKKVAIGGRFDGPEHGSLGEFIQTKLKIKMNPAVYMAALLIQERYAEDAGRGYIRFRPMHS